MGNICLNQLVIEWLKTDSVSYLHCLKLCNVTTYSSSVIVSVSVLDFRERSICDTGILRFLPVQELIGSRYASFLECLGAGLWWRSTNELRLLNSAQSTYLCDTVSIFFCLQENKHDEKSAQRRRKHCALAVVRRSEKFSPRRRPPSRGRGTTKI